MSLNSSLFSNYTPPLASSFTIHELLHKCMNSTVGTFSMTAFAIGLTLLLLPLCIYVLYLGYQRWSQQHSGTTMSHSDVFTYHMVVIELLNVLGANLCCCGVHADITVMVMLGVYLFSVILSAQLSFHFMTCIERYLAVVHPVTYIGLRNGNGIRIRNIIIGFFWLMSFAGAGFMSMADHSVITLASYCIVAFAVIVMSFCSISVLCVLVRHGPGEKGKDRQRVDQSKLRAFYTIMAILGVLVLRIVGNIYTNILYDSQQLGEAQRCGVWLSELWFCLPSSLVLPMLFLHRTGKLSCGRKSPVSENTSH